MSLDNKAALSSFSSFHTLASSVKDVEWASEWKEKEERLREQHPGSCIFSDNKKMWARKLALRAPAVTRATSSSSLTGMRFQEHWASHWMMYKDVDAFLFLFHFARQHKHLWTCAAAKEREQRKACARVHFLFSLSLTWTGWESTASRHRWWSRSKESKKKVESHACTHTGPTDQRIKKDRNLYECWPSKWVLAQRFLSFSLFLFSWGPRPCYACHTVVTQSVLASKKKKVKEKERETGKPRHKWLCDHRSICAQAASCPYKSLTPAASSMRVSKA